MVPAAVEEILRHPGPIDPLQTIQENEGTPRYANAPVEIQGVTIEAGDLILLATRSGNTDQHIFSQPEAFIINRERHPHLTFGHGPHFCIGAHLARIELQAVFGSLFQRFPTLRLAIPVADLKVRTDSIVRGGIEQLPVIW
ncbi:MAG: cytochrome P450 [Candidatus Dormibacteraceae bacterium]